MSDLRMPNTNLIIIAGRLTRDPEQREGGPVRFGIAWQKNKDDVCFFDCQAWEKVGERVMQDLRKGDPVQIEGRLDQWKADDDKRHTRIVAYRLTQLAWKDGAGASSSKRETAAAVDNSAAPENSDDSIPF